MKNFKVFSEKMKILIEYDYEYIFLKSKFKNKNVKKNVPITQFLKKLGLFEKKSHFFKKIITFFGLGKKI